jgi:hypothetical protein
MARCRGRIDGGGSAAPFSGRSRLEPAQDGRSRTPDIGATMRPCQCAWRGMHINVGETTVASPRQDAPDSPESRDPADARSCAFCSSFDISRICLPASPREITAPLRWSSCRNLLGGPFILSRSMIALNSTAKSRATRRTCSWTRHTIQVPKKSRQPREHLGQTAGTTGAEPNPAPAGSDVGRNGHRA